MNQMKLCTLCSCTVHVLYMCTVYCMYNVQQSNVGLHDVHLLHLHVMQRAVTFYSLYSLLILLGIQYMYSMQHVCNRLQRDYLPWYMYIGVVMMKRTLVYTTSWYNNTDRAQEQKWIWCNAGIRSIVYSKGFICVWVTWSTCTVYMYKLYVHVCRVLQTSINRIIEANSFCFYRERCRLEFMNWYNVVWAFICSCCTCTVYLFGLKKSVKMCKN